MTHVTLTPALTPCLEIFKIVAYPLKKTAYTESYSVWRLKKFAQGNNE